MINNMIGRKLINNSVARAARTLVHFSVCPDCEIMQLPQVLTRMQIYKTNNLSPLFLMETVKPPTINHIAQHKQDGMIENYL